MHTVHLPHDADFDRWRAEARALLLARVRPEDVSWQVGSQGQGGLFSADESGIGVSSQSDVQAARDPACNDVQAGDVRDESDRSFPSTPRVPPAFLALAETASLHSDPQRFGLLYRLLWRHSREPDLRHDALDPDVVRAHALAQSVRRDMHKMKAFVRFRELATPQGPRFVAWFEPDHHTLEATAPFFARRFTQMRWAILTPRRSVSWDGRALTFGPGAPRSDAPPEDAIESLWLTYYEHIFNPARLKLAAMQSEMPQKYWRNLPEAVLIAPLTARAHERADTMVREGPTPVNPRTAAWVAAPMPLLPLDAMSARDQASACQTCAHAKHATQTVWGEGPRQAPLMFVGEQPGDQEDLHGRPFVGPAGRLFDNALAAASLARKAVYLTNAVKHFKFEPQGKRRLHKTPGQREIEACKQWLEHELAQVSPRLVVALGATAASALMGEKVAVTENRGRCLQRADGLRVLVTWHPAALLRMPDDRKAEAHRQWAQDLRTAAALSGMVAA